MNKQCQWLKINKQKATGRVQRVVPCRRKEGTCQRAQKPTSSIQKYSTPFLTETGLLGSEKCAQIVFFGKTFRT